VKFGVSQNLSLHDQFLDIIKRLPEDDISNKTDHNIKDVDFFEAFVAYLNF
jgi:hypothetical protein